MTTRPALPVTIIGGFLGAGKTTLLNRILQEPGNRRLAVLVNDFGKINIDESLVLSREGRTLALANGCICCSIGNDFVSALVEILNWPVRPDHLIIEASGIADPSKVATLVEIDREMRLDGLLVMIDTPVFEEQTTNAYLRDTLERQSVVADILICNKTDGIALTTLRRVQTRLSALNPDAGMILAEYANVPTSVLFGIERIEPPALSCGEPTPFRTWYGQSRYPLNKEAFIAMTTALPASILRGKGIVVFADDTASTFVWQMAGGRISPLETINPERAPVQGHSALVLVGTEHMPGADALNILFEKVQTRPEF